MTPWPAVLAQSVRSNTTLPCASLRRMRLCAKGQAIEMGEMGTYQTFMQTPLQGGGMMNRAPHMPISYWGFYFAVEGIDAAAKRCTDNGGSIVFGPMQVPGGQWIVNCMDPQGAHFSMVSNTK